MKALKRVLATAGVAAALILIPIQTADAYWPGAGPGFGPWRHSYVYDPAYRWGPPAVKNYIRDLYRRGPAYANWHQSRRYGYGWW